MNEKARDMRYADERPSRTAASTPYARRDRSGHGAKREDDDGRRLLDQLLSDGTLWGDLHTGENPAAGPSDARRSPSEKALERLEVQRRIRSAGDDASRTSPAENAERRRDLEALFAEDAVDEDHPETARKQVLDAILTILENETQITGTFQSANLETSEELAEAVLSENPIESTKAKPHASRPVQVFPVTTAANRPVKHAASQADWVERDARQPGAEQGPKGDEAADHRDAQAHGVEGDEAPRGADGASAAPPVPVPAITATPPARVRTTSAHAPSVPAEAPQRRRSDLLDDVLDLGPRKRKRKRANRWLVRGVWAVLLAALVYVAFQPYSFEVGGEFVVQPTDRAEVRARTDGEIIEVRVTEGDWVKQGEVLAVLSDWDEVREIALLENEVTKLEAELRTLLNGATPEEIAAAEQRVKTARVRVDIAQANLERQQLLVERNVAPANTLNELVDEVQLAEAGLEEAEAALSVIRSEASESEIAAAQAAIDRTGENLAFSRQQLEHTMIRATVDGQIVSSLSDVPVGAFLPEGGLFTELQDNRNVMVEIEVPETEIDEVQIGAEAELRPWSTPDQSIFGTVRNIAPTAAERDFGRIVRVLVQVPNPNGRLAANMTGYAKIDAEDRPVWQAFTRVFVRFFEVEIWSWLP